MDLNGSFIGELIGKSQTVQQQLHTFEGFLSTFTKAHARTPLTYPTPNEVVQMVFVLKKGLIQ